MQGKLNPISAATIDSYTKLLLHGDGPDASTNIIDVTGKVVTPSGNARLGYSPKIGEGCIAFDGSGDYLEIPDSDDFNFGSGDFTIECWFNLPAISGGSYPLDIHPIFGQWQNDNNLLRLFFYPPEGNFYWIVRTDSISGWHLTYFTAPFVPSINTWYHLAVTRSNGIMKIFVNGTSLPISWQFGNGSETFPDLSGLFTIGYGTYNAGEKYYLKGQIDEFRISKGIARYIENFLVDSATSKVVTNNNVTISNTIKKFGHDAAYFNNSSSLYLLPSSDWEFGSGDFTFDFWINQDNISQVAIIYLNSDTSNGATSLTVRTAPDGKFAIYQYISNVFTWYVGNTNLAITANTWNHIAIIRQGSTINFYINGVAATTEYYSVPASVCGNAENAIWMGVRGNMGDNTLLGYLDEFRVSKGIARWTENFVPPTESYTSDAYDKLLLHFDNPPFVPSIEPYTSDSYTKLLCHFEDYSDSGATGHTVTPNGNTHIETKKLGNNAIRLDGNSSYLTILDNDNFAYGSGDFTIDCWIYIVSFNGNSYVYRQWQDSEHEFVIYITDNGLIRFHSYSGVEFEFIKETQADVINIGQWYHIACTREGNTANIFVNGVKESCPTYNTNPSGSLTNFSAPVTISVNTTSASFFIDEFRVSKGIARWGETFLTDFANAKTVTNSGVTPSSAIKKFGNSSAQFDGTNDMLSVPASSDWVLPGDFTIDAWIKIDTAKAQSIFACITAISGYQYDLRLESDRQVAFYAYDGTTGLFLYGLGTGTAKVSLDVWTHVALVRSGSTVTIYLDGQAVATQNSTSEVYGTSNNLFGIGAFPDGEGLYFDGFIDEFRFSKGIARWTENFVPPTAYHIVDSYDKLLLHLDIALFTPLSLPYSKEEVTKINFPGFQKIYDHICDGSESKLSVAVDGDTDKEYQIMVYNSSMTNILFRLNNDSGGNYGRQYLQNYIGNLTSGRETAQSSFLLAAGLQGLTNLSLLTPIGFIKTLYSSEFYHSSGTTIPTLLIAGWVYNSTLNISSLDFINFSGTFTTGSRITVYARRSN